jgi:hypothetical protein
LKVAADAWGVDFPAVCPGYGEAKSRAAIVRPETD